MRTNEQAELWVPFPDAFAFHGHYDEYARMWSVFTTLRNHGQRWEQAYRHHTLEATAEEAYEFVTRNLGGWLLS